MKGWMQVIAALALIVLVVTHAAPTKDGKTEISEDAAPEKITDTSETEVKPQDTVSSEEGKTSQEAKEDAVSKEETEVEEGSGLGASDEKDEQVVDTKEEVQNIEGDNDVTNDHNEGSYTGSFGDNFEEYRLSERDAEELLRELSDPADVALFIMESDDVNGFLRSVQMLLDQGYISDEYAFFLKEAVSEQLDQLLMLQNEEFYEDPLAMQTADVGNDYVNEYLNKPVPYFPEDYFDNTLPYEDTAAMYPEPDYEMIQQPYSEETMALAEIANIIADQIENGQMSTERGERIIDILSQLLPGTFWEDEEVPDDEMMEGLGEAFANLYPPMPMGEQYQTFETEDDEPLPGGERHTEKEVVVDSEGRPVAETVKEEAQQVMDKELTGDEAEEVEGELEKELMEMEPDIPDDMEEALQDVEKLATAEKEATEDEEEEIQDDMEKDEWKDLVLLLEGGEISDALMKELGLTSQDIMDLTGQLEAVDKDMKP